MAFRGIRGSIRFVVKPDYKDEVNSRTVVVHVLMEVLDLRVRDILFLQDFLQQRIYDITFVSVEVCWNIYEKVRNVVNVEILQKFDVTPLFMQKEKTIVVHMYIPFA